MPCQQSPPDLLTTGQTKPGEQLRPLRVSKDLHMSKRKAGYEHMIIALIILPNRPHRLLQNFKTITVCICSQKEMIYVLNYQNIKKLI